MRSGKGALTAADYVVGQATGFLCRNPVSHTMKWLGRYVETGVEVASGGLTHRKNHANRARTFFGNERSKKLECLSHSASIVNHYMKHLHSTALHKLFITKEVVDICDRENVTIQPKHPSHWYITNGKNLCIAIQARWISFRNFEAVNIDRVSLSKSTAPRKHEALLAFIIRQKEW